MVAGAQLGFSCFIAKSPSWHSVPGSHPYRDIDPEIGCIPAPFSLIQAKPCRVLSCGSINAAYQQIQRINTNIAIIFLRAINS